MTEWNNSKDHAFTVLYKLYSSPAFKGNFSDIEEFTKMLKERNPASLKVCVLLDKPARREQEIYADYVGYTIPDAFVVGYGLDYAEEYRNLPYIGVLSPSVYSHE